MIGAVLLPLLYTICLEVPVVALLYPGHRKRLAAVCLVATSLTLLNMHLLLPQLIDDHALVVVVGEVIALGAEAAAYILAHGAGGWSRALVASALANALSFGASQVAAVF